MADRENVASTTDATFYSYVLPPKFFLRIYIEIFSPFSLLRSRVSAGGDSRSRRRKIVESKKAGVVPSVRGGFSPSPPHSLSLLKRFHFSSKNGR